MSYYSSNVHDTTMQLILFPMEPPWFADSRKIHTKFFKKYVCCLFGCNDEMIVKEL